MSVRSVLVCDHRVGNDSVLCNEQAQTRCMICDRDSCRHHSADEPITVDLSRGSDGRLVRVPVGPICEACHLDLLGKRGDMPPVAEIFTALRPEIITALRAHLAGEALKDEKK